MTADIFERRWILACNASQSERLVCHRMQELVEILGATTTVYRYVADRHYYSANQSENVASGVNNTGPLFSFEGPAFTILTIPLPGTIPWYRCMEAFYDTLYKANWEAIVSNLTSIVSNGVNKTDVMGYVYRTPQRNSVPLYHYVHNTSLEHFYTIYAAEINTTTRGQTGRHGFISQGAAAYVFR